MIAIATPRTRSIVTPGVVDVPAADRRDRPVDDGDDDEDDPDEGGVARMAERMHGDLLRPCRAAGRGARTAGSRRRRRSASTARRASTASWCLRRELAGHPAIEHDAEHDHAAEDVRAVEAR